jgi:hypothetical protein
MKTGKSSRSVDGVKKQERKKKRREKENPFFLLSFSGINVRWMSTVMSCTYHVFAHAYPLPPVNMLL